MTGINAYAEKSSPSGDFLRQEAFVKKTQAQIAASLNSHASQISSIKAGTRGASVQVSKKAAAATGQAPASIFLTTQVAALESKITRKAIKDENVLGACQSIMRAIKGQFADSDFDRKDDEFIAAAERLRDIAIAAIDMRKNESSGEPVHDLNSGVTAVAAKSRDSHGRAIRDAPAVERDGYGRRI